MSPMRNEDVEILLKKYAIGECTAAEKALVESWYLTYQDKDHFTLSEEDQAEDLNTVWERLNPAKKPNQKHLWPKLIAAASVILIFTLATFYIKQHKNSLRKEEIANIKPGGHKAILTTASGKKIVLNETKGVFAVADGISATSTADGQLVYHNDDRVNGKVDLNTIEVPVGGQWQVNLPDGTAVFLNAQSKLTFPTRFTGKSRSVTLSGEGYFEVAHDKNMPFQVKTSEQIVEVLGTHFDVMAYANEPTKTTLIEGAVNLRIGTDIQPLKPGEQAELSKGNLNIKNVDIEEVLAWKNGYFKFKESLEDIMKKIARWYDVEVVYIGNVDKNMKFGGEISRHKDLSAPLAIMEMSGKVHFKIEKRRIMVMQ